MTVVRRATDPMPTSPRPPRARGMPRRLWLHAALAGGLAPWGSALGAQPMFKTWPSSGAVPTQGLLTLDGSSWRLADLRGRAVLLNFWASWCEPCRAEMPSLELLAARHEAAGLEVLAVNVKEGVGTIRRFLEQTGTSLPVLRDPDGLTAKAWGARMYPTTVGIARDGQPRWTALGEADWQSATARPWVATLLR